MFFAEMVFVRFIFVTAAENFVFRKDTIPSRIAPRPVGF